MFLSHFSSYNFPFSKFQGYTKPREYIVTEWPLQKTCGEFWSLVYDHECSAIVVLCQPPQLSVRSASFNRATIRTDHPKTSLLFLPTATISFLLARGSPLEKVRPRVHDRPHLAQSLRQHQVLDLPDQQEGHLADGADGGRQGAAQNGAALSADLLADGAQGLTRTRVDLLVDF